MTDENAAPPHDPDAMKEPAPTSESEISSPPSPAQSDVPQEERTFGMLAHLAALSGFIGVPFGFILGPLIIWLIKKDTMPFVDEQGKESMNFQITAVIAMIICVPLVFLIIGILLLPAVAIATLVFTIIGAVKANNGEHYTYPFALRLIK